MTYAPDATQLRDRAITLGMVPPLPATGTVAPSPDVPVAAEVDVDVAPIVAIRRVVRTPNRHHFTADDLRGVADLARATKGHNGNLPKVHEIRHVYVSGTVEAICNQIMRPGQRWKGRLAELSCGGCIARAGYRQRKDNK